MIRRSTKLFSRASAALAIAAALAAPALADITWIVNPGSTITLSGSTIVVANVYPWLEQAPGSMTSTLSGTFATNNAFTTAINFGAKPVYPGRPGSDQPASVYSQWADVDLPASAAAQNKIVAANSGTWSAYFAPPTARTPLSPVPPTPGSAPAVFGFTAIADTIEGTYDPSSMRDYRLTFWTNTTDPAPTYKVPAYFPTGAPINQTNGHFDAGVAGSGTYLNWDNYWPTFFGGALLGRTPTRGTDANKTTDPGVISRNGADYVMTIPHSLRLYAAGVSMPSTVDLYLQSDVLINATANIVPGDVNFDGIVNLVDVQVVGGNWQATNVAHLGLGDANGDGIVNLVDVQVVGGHWMQTTPPIPATAVPEPATWALAVLAAIGLLVGIRRRRNSAPLWKKAAL